MVLPCFTYEEKLADGGVRRKWFDVEHNALPPVFYLALRQPLTLTPDEFPSQSLVLIKVARYERVGRRHFPCAARGTDVYEYKGDEVRQRGRK